MAWSRFALAAVLMPFVKIQKSDLVILLNWRVIVRACFISGGILSILTALKTEPIANVYGAFFIGPIVSYLLAYLFLGENTSKVKTGLLLIGFMGVLFVVKPGFGMSGGLFFALLAGFCFGGYLVMGLSRRLAARHLKYRPIKLIIWWIVLVRAIPLWPAFWSGVTTIKSPTVQLWKTTQRRRLNRPCKERLLPPP